jgi:hypothetical protein
VQAISPSIEEVCRKTLQDVNRGSEQNPRPKNSVKNYMSAKVGWAVGFIDFHEKAFKLRMKFISSLR